MRTQRRRSISDFSYTPLVAALSLAMAPLAAQAATITVTNNADSGAGSLRDAIGFLNTIVIDEETETSTMPNCSGSDTINFSSPFVISVSSQMTINCPGVTIDGGGTQTTSGVQLVGSGGGLGQYMLYANTPDANVTFQGLDLSGWTYGSGDAYALAGFLNANSNIIHANSNGIYIASYGASIQSNTIFGNDGDGIDFSGGGGEILDNWIGVDTNGNWAGNGYTGIWGDESSLDIEGNTISGQTFTYGSAIALTFDNGSFVGGNTIGLDPTRTFEIGNYNGIYLADAFDTEISGGNVISVSYGGAGIANFGGGIYIDQGSENITIDGNYIGTDSSGGNAHLNSNGILALCSSEVSVTGNFIAASDDYAIEFFGVAGGGSMDIVGNHINVSGNGVTVLGTSSYGVLLQSDLCPSRLAVNGKKKHGVASKGKKKSAVRTKSVSGANTNLKIDSNVIVGVSQDGLYLGAADGTQITGNTISGNGNTGINVTSGATNTTISGNTINTNSSDGISVFSPSPTPTTISGNTINSNAGYGIDVAYGATINIANNTSIYGNATSSEITFKKAVNLDFPGAVYRNPSPTTPNGSRPNNGLSAPTINSAIPSVSTGQTTISVSLSAPPGSYSVLICDNPPTTSPNCNHIAYGGGFGVPVSGTVTTNFVINSTSYDNFSAMVTDASGDSSEFSEIVTLTPLPAATYAPTAIDFGPVASGSVSAPVNITITSTGSAPYRIDAPTAAPCYGGLVCGGEFSCTTTCLPSHDYAPGSVACTITATFHPTSVGTAPTQTIQICDNAEPNHGQSITLDGTGVTPPPVAFDPLFFDFGPVQVGSKSKPQAFSLLNTGTSTITLGTPVLDDNDFVLVDDTCGPTLAPSASCEIDIAFAPLGYGPIGGALSLPASISEGALRIKRIVHGKAITESLGPSAVAQFTGTGVAIASITLPTSVDLGTYTVGDPANTQAVTFTNSGNAPVNFSSITVTGPFGLANGCTAPLQPGTSCTLILSYASAVLGDHTGSLVVQSDAVGGSGSIALKGKSVPSPVPILTIQPAQISFGDRLLGSASDPQRITISNIGNASGSIGFLVSNTDFIIGTTTCTASLAPGTSCFANVSLRPVGFGTRTGSFVVTSDAAGSPFSVPLSGSGCRPFNAASSRLGSSFGCSP